MKDKMLYCTAKDLCMRSCSQIMLFREFPEKKPKTDGTMSNSEKFRHSIAGRVAGLIGEEMGGFYRVSDRMCVMYTSGIVCNDKIIEVKTVANDRPLQDWYLKGSLLQCAIHKTMFRLCGGSISTSNLFVEAGNDKHSVVLDPEETPYYLMFGRKNYRIFVSDYDKIAAFIADKARATISWDSARMFDAQWKRKEFDRLSPAFTYEEVPYIKNFKKVVGMDPEERPRQKRHMAFTRYDECDIITPKEILDELPY